MVDQRRDRVIISLGWTKSGKRQGAAESCIIGFDIAVRFIRRRKSLATTSTSFCTSPQRWRLLFNEALQALKLPSFDFRPYSLRRGGATWWFSKHHSLDQILLQGRWQAAKTARIYLNEGLAALAEMKLPKSRPSLAPFLHVFRTQSRRICFATLEPPARKRPGRTGGRGGKTSKRSNRQKRSLLFVSQV